ncbi:Uncharacterised protein [Mycobacterium tuberculosis]|nr:Uncharacterised protein [Mycobacterium tuberculosis]
MQHGLVPKRPSPPPQGATTGRDSTLTKCIDTNPCAVAISAKCPMRPRWCACESVKMQLPCCLARAMPSSIACTPTTCP